MESDDLFDLLANPEKIHSKSGETEPPTIDDEIIRLLNIKLNELNMHQVIDIKKFEKIIKNIKILK